MANDDHHDVIIERDGTGVGTVLGIILAVVVVLAIVWFFFLGGMGPATQPGDQTTIEIQQPNPVEPPANQPPAY